MSRSIRRLAATASAVGLTATALIGAAQAAPAADDDATPKADKRAAILDGQRVAGDLGATSSGVYVDGDRTVVNVTKRSAFDKVRTAGATPRLVENSAAELDRVRTAIDNRTDIVGTSWAVDPVTNTVRVRADQGVTKRQLKQLRSATAQFGDKVDITRVEGNLRTTIAGGDAIWGGGSRCSLGFHVTDGTDNFFLTAGHCTNAIDSWFEDEGQNTKVGDTVEGSFPGDDYGLATMEGDGGQGEVNTYDGSSTDITGARDATVGETVQRSGSTTQLHDGSVSAVDASVTYPEGTVDGLIETDVCAEPGDSGGALFAGNDAIGLTSGGNGDCSSGGTTYFQPVTEALSQYGMEVY